jgi:hypothetical protein
MAGRQRQEAQAQKGEQGQEEQAQERQTRLLLLLLLLLLPRLTPPTRTPHRPRHARPRPPACLLQPSHTRQRRRQRHRPRRPAAQLEARCSLCLLYWYKSTNTDAAQPAGGHDTEGGDIGSDVGPAGDIGPARPPAGWMPASSTHHRCSIYLLYWYKSTNTDACLEAAIKRATRKSARANRPRTREMRGGMGGGGHALRGAGGARRDAGV